MEGNDRPHGATSTVSGRGRGREDTEKLTTEWSSPFMPDDGDTKPTVRNRLKGAANRRGLSIVFQRTRDLSVVFHLEQIEE